MTTLPRREKSTFLCKGETCAASLWLPETDNPNGHPAILAVHGWGGIQQMLIHDYIRAFTQAGYAVMTFDYIGWGDSSGWPRNTISPWVRVKTADAALAHLKSQASVDERHIVLWGSSFGGGHVIDLAARHGELAGAIAQVPMLNGMAAVRAVPFSRLCRFALDITLDVVIPWKRRYLPVVSEPGEYSTMDRDGAMRAHTWTETELNGRYENSVTAASLLTMGLYHPRKRLPDIDIPVQIIGASRDTVAPFNEAAVKKIAPAHADIRVMDANHFDPYLQPWFEITIKWQLEFLNSLHENLD